jgi:hypothetical protein
MFYEPKCAKLFGARSSHEVVYVACQRRRDAKDKSEPSVGNGICSLDDTYGECLRCAARPKSKMDRHVVYLWG